MGGKGKGHSKKINLDTPNPADGSGLGGGAILTANFGTGFSTSSESEREKYDTLIQKVTSCENCPHSADSYCVRHVNGAHVRITAQHVKSWAKLWVCLRFLFTLSCVILTEISELQS